MNILDFLWDDILEKKQIYLHDQHIFIIGVLLLDFLW